MFLQQSILVFHARTGAQNYFATKKGVRLIENAPPLPMPTPHDVLGEQRTRWRDKKKNAKFLLVSIRALEVEETKACKTVLSKFVEFRRTVNKNKLKARRRFSRPYSSFPAQKKDYS